VSLHRGREREDWKWEQQLTEGNPGIRNGESNMAEGNRNEQVSLGCGTLILIALIVIFFSGRGVDDLEREVHGLRAEVAELKQSIEAQTNQIKQLQEKVTQPPRLEADEPAAP
jgi:hypothetical protein